MKNTNLAEEKGYDNHKKVSGIKLHMVVDTLGLPHALFVSKASMTDRKGAISMMECQKDSLCSIQTFLVDGGYMGETFAKEVKNLFPHAKVEVVKRDELHTFQVLPKRWVVERSFGWLEQDRRLWKNCERKLHTSLEMTVLAFLFLLLKRY